MCKCITGDSLPGTHPKEIIKDLAQRFLLQDVYCNIVYSSKKYLETI